MNSFVASLQHTLRASGFDAKKNQLMHIPKGEQHYLLNCVNKEPKVTEENRLFAWDLPASSEMSSGKRSILLAFSTQFVSCIFFWILDRGVTAPGSDLISSPQQSLSSIWVKWLCNAGLVSIFFLDQNWFPKVKLEVSPFKPFPKVSPFSKAWSKIHCGQWKYSHRLQKARRDPTEVKRSAGSLLSDTPAWN